MPDNVVITSGTGVTIATDDDGSAQHQWVKIEIGANGSFVPVTTANGLPVQILSLPALAVGSIVSVSGLTSASVSISNGSINITSLPPLGAATVSLSAGTIISVSGLTSAIVSISNLPISVKVESLSALAIGSIVSVSGLTSASVSISNLASTLLSVNAINITSLPALGLGSIVSISPSSVISITGLSSATVSLSAGTAVTISNLASVPVTVSGTTIAISPHANYFSFSATYTAALTTGSEIKAIVGSTSAIVITDIHFSNGATQGNMALYCSRSNAALITLIADTHFMDRGGLVSNLGTPLVCDTNSALLFTTMSCTSHSIMISGYTI